MVATGENEVQSSFNGTDLNLLNDNWKESVEKGVVVEIMVRWDRAGQERHVRQLSSIDTGVSE